MNDLDNLISKIDNFDLDENEFDDLDESDELHQPEDSSAIMNQFLMDVFNGILRREERSICVPPYSDLTINEFHVLDAVCRANDKKRDNRASSIAKTLDITAGSFTISVATLEKKGYLSRCKDKFDRRIVHVIPTEKGIEANKVHLQFHRQMVDEIIAHLSDEEIPIFTKAIETIAHFFQ